MLSTDAFKGKNVTAELWLLFVGYVIFFLLPLFVCSCIIFPFAVLHQCCPEQQADPWGAPWTLLHTQHDAALLNRRWGGLRKPWTPQWGWQCSTNPASAEGSVPPLTTGGPLWSWELIFGALSVAADLTVNKGLEMFREFGRGLTFSTLFPAGSSWSLLKTQLPPKPAGKMLLTLCGRIAEAAGCCSPQKQMVRFLTQAILSHALDFGEPGFNSWRLSWEAGCPGCFPALIYNTHMQRGHWFILQAASVPKKQI